MLRAQGQTRLEAKKGGASINKNSVPLICPACLPKFHLPLRKFQDGGFFCWLSTENSEKIRPIWREDLFFFPEINSKLREE